MTAAKNLTDAMVEAAQAEMLALLNIKPRLTAHTRAILEAALAAAPAGEVKLDAEAVAKMLDARAEHGHCKNPETPYAEGAKEGFRQAASLVRRLFSQPQAATKSAPSFASSLPSGESGPSVTTPMGGADTAPRREM